MTTTTVTEGPAVLIGYAWRLQIEAEAPVFTEGASYAGQIRERPNAADVLATLTSADLGILRISDTLLELALRPDQTAGLAPGRVVLDLVRTDLAPDLHLGFLLELPVILPVTRGLAP
ncbi:hypothetical protein SAMN05444421_1331 [Celeribacter marinus]|uniref:hypothetical protein n=1 Tax=Celeribacter marinus TaxID=1397108 RepID=UPI0008F3A4BA|nr:hypothetical protein [Celeribacter marinus]SFL11528.1 hypothetical protein SAMN05444421_1331 [Celeribacter marinus]